MPKRTTSRNPAPKRLRLDTVLPRKTDSGLQMVTGFLETEPSQSLPRVLSEFEHVMQECVTRLADIADDHNMTLDKMFFIYMANVCTNTISSLDIRPHPRAKLPVSKVTRRKK
jgi:hypothetical protein